MIFKSKVISILTVVGLFLTGVVPANAKINTPEEEAAAQKKILQMHLKARESYPVNEEVRSHQISCFNHSMGEVIDSDANTLVEKGGSCRQFSAYYLKFLIQEIGVRATLATILRGPKGANLKNFNKLQLALLSRLGVLDSHTVVLYELMPKHYFILDPAIQDPNKNCLSAERYFNLQNEEYDLAYIAYFDANLCNNPNMWESIKTVYLYDTTEQPTFLMTPFSFD